MRIRPSVAARLVLIGFLAAVAWGLQSRVQETREVVAETLALDVLGIAFGEVIAAEPVE